MKKTILIAEDFQTSAFVLKATLEGSGYKVITSNDGQNALKEFNGQTIDLLISDHHMPNMTGLELVEEVKRLEQYKKMPIFILSTDTDANLKQKARNKGVTAWLQKPFKLDRLMKYIAKAIQ